MSFGKTGNWSDGDDIANLDYGLGRSPTGSFEGDSHVDHIRRSQEEDHQVEEEEVDDQYGRGGDWEPQVEDAQDIKEEQVLKQMSRAWG